MVQSGESVWEPGLAAPVRVTENSSVNKIKVCFLDALTEEQCFFSPWAKRKRRRRRQGKAAAFAPLCGSLARRLLVVELLIV